MSVEIWESAIHGEGVFVTWPIACGEVILSIDDSRIVDAEHPIRRDLGENLDHCDYLPEGTTVLMQKPAGYFSRACNPNVFGYSVDRRLFVLAMRDIAEGEELLFDYSINAVNGDVWTCDCGAVNCRGRHKCDFFALPERKQLEYLPFLDPRFAQAHRARIQELLTRCAE